MQIYYSLVLRQIKNSSLKKDEFANIVERLYNLERQLIRDVVTCWSSTLLMIKRVLALRKVRNFIFMSCFNTDINLGY